MSPTNTAPSSTANLFADALKAKADAPEVNQEIPETELDEELDEAPTKESELDMLKNRARLMGIPFSNNLKDTEVLKAKIKAKLDGETKEPLAANEDNDEDNYVNSNEDQSTTAALAGSEAPATTTAEPKQTKQAKARTLRQQQYEEQMKLVRVRITNLNPSKKDLPGEIFTFANRVLGAVRKYVPYGDVTENGYHIPFCIYTQLKEREFLNIKTRKDSRGRTINETSMAREFALEVLPPLTEGELAKLSAAQAAAKGMD